MKQPSSAAARHLRAKLALLRRPAVWGAGLFLLLPLLFLADYWVNPQRGRFNSSRPAPNFVDPGSSAVDSFAVPNNSVPDASTAPLATGGNAQLQDELTRLLLTAPDSGAASTPGSTANKPANTRNSRTAAPANPTASTGIPSTTSLSGSSGFAMQTGSTTQGTASANSQNSMTGLSPLQSALDRAAGATPNASSGLPANTPIEPGIAGSSPSVTQLYNPGTVTSGAFPQPSGQTYLPQTSPAPGTTGYTLPPALRTPANTPANRSFYPPNSASWSVNSPANPTMQPIPGTPAAPLQSLPSPPSYPAPTYVAPQSQVQPAPFSIPRTPPGRQIGNGEINTFSNP